MKHNKRFWLLIGWTCVSGLFVATCGSGSEEEEDKLEIRTTYTVPPYISIVNPSDGTSDISTDSAVSVTFSKVMNALTVTTNTTQTACSGTLQLSANGFSTCVQMSDLPAASAGNTTFTITPFANLAIKTTYKIKITNEAKDTTGNGMASTYLSANGFTTSEISAWRFVDGDATEDGINNSTANPAVTPRLAVFDSKLYAVWSEIADSGRGQIRIAVYNGIDSAPGWSFVDGDIDDIGINKNSSFSAMHPEIVAFDSKLYATWTENNSSGKTQVRVAVYNGDDANPSWSFVDGGSASGGINLNADASADLPCLTVLKSRLFIGWHEDVGTNTKVHVKVYNRDDLSPFWTSVDGSADALNRVSSHAAAYVRLTALDSKMYAIWSEADTLSNLQIRIAQYNDNDSAPYWNTIESTADNAGINRNSSYSANNPRLGQFDSKLYATWWERNSVNDGQIRVAVYNGDTSSPSWRFIDGDAADAGINKSGSESANGPQLAAYGSRLFAIWNEDNSSDTNQVRMAVNNGDDSTSDWDFVDGNAANVGINKSSAMKASSPAFLVYNNRLYAIWQEDNSSSVSQIRVAVAE